MLKHIIFYVRDLEGKLIRVKGAYYLTDGGYLELACFLYPERNRVELEDVLFSEWLESIRKDIERIFGRLKLRFRILYNTIELHDFDQIEDVFKTCCVLHNMILVYDGNHRLKGWESVKWQPVNPDNDSDDDNNHGEEDSSDDDDDDDDDIDAYEDNNARFDNDPTIETIELNPSSKVSHEVLRQLVRDNFIYMFRNKLLRWPKGNYLRHT